MFKLIDVGEGPNRRTQPWIPETDSHGTERPRRAEFFLHGIVGHVKDKWGYSMIGWREASKIANYWRRHFHIEEVPHTSYQIEPHEQQENNDIPENSAGDAPADDDVDDTSNMEIPPETADQVPSVPMQISQLAHILYDALIWDRELNAPILELLQIPPQDPTESNLRLFTTAELAQLGGHLAATANVLARSANPEDFPADFSDEDDQAIP